MSAWLGRLPEWATPVLSSLVALGSSYLLGQFVRRVVCGRLSVLARRTSWQWDEVVIEGLRRGVPFWSLMLGLSIALGFWRLPGTLSAFLTKALFVLIGLSVTFLIADIAGRLVLLYGSRIHHALPVTSLTQHVAQIAIVATGLLMILQGLGVSIAPLLTALGVGGLAVALALQDTLSNLFAGLYITIARQIRVGDYVKLEPGEEGHVTDIGWRVTKIRTLSSNVVLIPNAKLSQSIITNYDLPDRELAVLIEVGADYSGDLERIERVTVEVARDVLRTVAGGVPAFEPVVRYHSFGDFSVRFTVVLRAVTFVDQYLIKHEFIKRLHSRYRQEGIVIPFPTQTVYAR